MPVVEDSVTTIVAAYLAHHKTDDLPGLIKSVRAALQGDADIVKALRDRTAWILENNGKTFMHVDQLVPAVPVADSVTPDHVVCLEDGKKFRMLKRHLAAVYGLTPGQYRQKWGLPDDYPMTAPNYAVRRSELAKANGLGKKRAVV